MYVYSTKEYHPTTVERMLVTTPRINPNEPTDPYQTVTGHSYSTPAFPTQPPNITRPSMNTGYLIAISLLIFVLVLCTIILILFIHKKCKNIGIARENQINSPIYNPPSMDDIQMYELENMSMV